MRKSPRQTRKAVATTQSVKEMAVASQQQQARQPERTYAGQSAVAPRRPLRSL